LAVYGQNIKWYLHSLDTFSFDNQPLLPTNHRIHDTVYVTQTVNGCESPKSQIVVRIIEKPKFDLGNDTILCHGKSFVLGKENDSIDFKWNTGQLGCCINVELPGTYILDGANVCGHYFDTVTIQSYPCDTCLWAPSAFTPNGDGRNDVFNVKVRCPIKEFKFVIHNRYGQTVFQGNAQHMGWDGTLFGVPQDPGVYFYFVELNTGIPDDDTKILKGDLTLIR
jgi:gliding motility-associated-like protein